jgi:lipopolysaccharide export system permease protein
MRIPMTLSFYIGRHFLLTILATILVMLVIVELIELLELVRRTADSVRPITLGLLLQMTLLKLPTTAEKIYPFAVMIGGMITLSRLTRSSELVVARAAGVSVWQFLLPGVAMVMLLGLLIVAVINPIAASTIGIYDRLEAKYITGKASVLSVSPSGLWMRQSDTDPIAFRNTTANEYIIHAVRMDQTSYTLETVMILLFDATHRFVGRIDAPSAQLMTGEWRISDAMLSTNQGLPTKLSEFRMPTSLTISHIQDSFSAPETFSFWQLPAFIAVLETAGFSALKHRLHFHSLMALPLLLSGMVLLAAVFSLRPPRRGRTGISMVIGLAAGFVLYFMTNIIYALGSAGDLPIALAAWAPSLIVAMVAGASLLHLEDG